jgi:hypothetical protein
MGSQRINVNQMQAVRAASRAAKVTPPPAGLCARLRLGIEPTIHALLLRSTIVS